MIYGVSLIAILLSTITFFVLIKSDAKRHRKSSNYIDLSRRTRKLIAYSNLLPGISLLALGNYTALLIWLGAITIVGWLIAMLPSRFA